MRVCCTKSDYLGKITPDLEKVQGFLFTTALKGK